MKFVCPKSRSWVRVHTALTKAWEEAGRQGSPPPAPLILAGWCCTNDLEKAQRWQETVIWARGYNVERFAAEVPEEDKYCVEEFTTCEVGPFGGPMYLPWSFDPKAIPDAESVKAALSILLKEWPSIVDSKLAGMTKPLRFSGQKKRRLVVKASAEQVPPWGGWNHLTHGDERRTFTRLRSAINQAIAPLVVDHVDFEPSAKWAGQEEDHGE